jgi:transposase
MASPKPKLTPAQVEDIKKMRAAKMSVAEIANAYGVSHMTIRRELEPSTHKTARHTPKTEYKPRAYGLNMGDRLDPVYRITDWPTTLTAALLGDPTPQRRKLMEEGRI